MCFALQNQFYKNSTFLRYLKQPSLLNSPNRSLTDYFKLLQHSRELRECLVKEASFKKAELSYLDTRIKNQV